MFSKRMTSFHVAYNVVMHNGLLLEADRTLASYNNIVPFFPQLFPVNMTLMIVQGVASTVSFQTKFAFVFEFFFVDGILVSLQNLIAAERLFAHPTDNTTATMLSTDMCSKRIRSGE